MLIMRVFHNNVKLKEIKVVLTLKMKRNNILFLLKYFQYTLALSYKNDEFSETFWDSSKFFKKLFLFRWTHTLFKWSIFKYVNLSFFRKTNQPHYFKIDEFFFFFLMKRAILLLHHINYIYFGAFWLLFLNSCLFHKILAIPRIQINIDWSKFRINWYLKS